ncbi:septal ring lytic transglycosylase RlpA family protein, partial [Synergistaceae bacterium OttesenSCG-928-I11]|nr:septal ring lytic transglycosylase RlpA family protein [Synergistaceae bacterium OttesenSCG-928-I11]
CHDREGWSLRKTRIAIVRTLGILAILLFFALPAHAWPSTTLREKDTVAWKVGDVLVWRFPAADEGVVRAMSDRFNAAYKKGFRLVDLKVRKHDGKWTLYIGNTALLAAAKGHARGTRTDPKTIGVLWLTRLYDAFGKMHAGSLSDRYKLKGGYAISSRISWYGGKFIGRKCANGEVFTDTHMSAAAKNLPFGTLVRVTVPATKKSVVVRVTDRFAEHKGRALDISASAAELLGIKRAGIANAQLQVIGRVDKIGGK